MLRRLLPTILALSAVACADDDPGYLRVRGAAVAVLPDGTETGFDFPNDVRLDDDRIARADGRIAGHCTIGTGGEGEHDVLHVGIRRTGADGDLGLRRLEIRMDDPMRGEVRAQLGNDSYEGSSEGECMLSRPYVERQDGLAAVVADCVVAGGDGRTAQLAVDLQFVGCTVE